jgi:hypothetical protein
MLGLNRQRKRASQGRYSQEAKRDINTKKGLTTHDTPKEFRPGAPVSPHGTHTIEIEVKKRESEAVYPKLATPNPHTHVRQVPLLLRRFVKTS